MLALQHSWQVTLTIAKVSGRIFKREFDSAQSSSTSTSEASYSKANGTVLDRLQGIFQQDDDDFDEPDEAPPTSNCKESSKAIIKLLLF